MLCYSVGALLSLSGLLWGKKMKHVPDSYSFYINFLKVTALYKHNQCFSDHLHWDIEFWLQHCTNTVNTMPTFGTRTSRLQTMPIQLWPLAPGYQILWRQYINTTNTMLTIGTRTLRFGASNIKKNCANTMLTTVTGISRFCDGNIQTLPIP